jgi:hypothetical protein
MTLISSMAAVIVGTPVTPGTVPRPRDKAAAWGLTLD